ncbi:MAG: glycosyltransferase [Paludibacter sp.]|nr:glycosyltransferase [Paludibacter sp.]
MKNNITLSIIIPCYNAGKYIELCLNSIYKQDLTDKSVEIICVDDCSTDKTVEIIKKNQLVHPNLILIQQSINQKQGAARNVGLKKARGKYIWFIDADDFIAENCLSNIIKELAENRLDILQFNIDVTDREGSKNVLDVNIDFETEVITGIDYLKLLMQKHWGRTVEVWRRVYNREYLIKNNLYFPEYVFGTEDLLFFYQSIVKCSRFKYITNIFYVYRTDNQQSVTNSSEILGIKLADKIISNVDLIHFFKNDSLINDDLFIKAAINSYKWSLHKYIKKIFLLDKNNLHDFFKKIVIYKTTIKKELNLFESNLITNSLLVKPINAIFVTIKNNRKILKKYK